MQQPPPVFNTTRPAPVLAPGAIPVAVRSSGGDGSRVFVVEAPARGTIADVKRLLCLPPHRVCRDSSALELVLKGEGAAVARAQRCLRCVLTCISRCDGQAASWATTLRSLQLLQHMA